MKPKFDRLSYRLRSLEFQNAARIGFTEARLLYNETDQIVAVVIFDETRSAFNAVKRVVGEDLELKTIFYDMELPEIQPIRFFHEMKKGAGVVVLPSQDNGVSFFIAQRDGRPIFTKEWNLNDVSEGRIPSTKSVWQFHGYKHEH